MTGTLSSEDTTGTLSLIGRSKPLFISDLGAHADELGDLVRSSSFLVLGGAGTIGQAVVKEIFERGPRKLHVVDISENNLAELVRDVRSSMGYIEGDFRTFALDIASVEYGALTAAEGGYDYVLNLSALKHVRSEKDPYTLMRMIDVNVLNTDETARWAARSGARKYFAVSTDKAANPVSMMGASKRIMELFLDRRSTEVPVSTARFANVAFSDGSLLHSFNQRLAKRQPIVAPNDVRRYFMTLAESGQLCLMSCLLGENRDVFFPRLSADVHLTTFAEIATRYLEQRGIEPVLCSSEDEARALVSTLPEKGRWPCLFAASDTSGEKEEEEFFTEGESLDLERFTDLGVVRDGLRGEAVSLEDFEKTIRELKARGSWAKEDLVDAFEALVPNFDHKETGKYLDGKM